MYCEGWNGLAPQTKMLLLSGEKAPVEVGSMVLSGIEGDRVGTEGAAPEEKTVGKDGDRAVFEPSERAMLGDITKVDAAASVELDAVEDAEEFVEGAATPLPGMLLESADACGGKEKVPGPVKRDEGSDPSALKASAAVFTVLAAAKRGGVAVLAEGRGAGVWGGDCLAEDSAADGAALDSDAAADEFTEGNASVGPPGVAGKTVGADEPAAEIDGGGAGRVYCSVAAAESGRGPPACAGVIEGSARVMLNAGDAEAAAAPSSCAAVSANISLRSFVEDDGVAESD